MPSTKIEPDHVKRFIQLFKGNPRTVGVWDPKNGRVRTESREATARDFQLHLEGTLGVGQVPILDDGSGTWGAIDIDCHGQAEEIDIVAVSKRAVDAGLPVVCCRSKSGGVHVYLFVEPTKAGTIQYTLRRWAAILGFPDSEIFPKQQTLKSGDGKLQAGNWINLPYFGNGSTTRYAVVAGKKVEFDRFLDCAEKSRTNISDIKAQVIAEHPDAPPCVQRMFVDGVASGYRNEALFNVAIYFRKSNPDSFVDGALQANNLIFAKPLARAEARRTIDSAGRPHYNYRCSEEPQRSYCDRPTCLTRKFGVSDGAPDGQGGSELPKFEDLCKYTTEPPRWEVTINGKRITGIQSDTLVRWDRMQVLIMEHLMFVPPTIKELEWRRNLGDMMTTARVLEAPDEASPAGQVRVKLVEFLNKIDWKKDPKTESSRLPLLRGLPIQIEDGGDKFAAFRGPDFADYLKRQKADDLKGVNMWFAIRLLGVEQKFIKIKKVLYRVWTVQVTDENRFQFEGQTPDAPKFESDL